jgi:hypothetical protein
MEASSKPKTRTQLLLAVARRILIRLRRQWAEHPESRPRVPRTLAEKYYPITHEQIYGSTSPSPSRTYQPPPPYLNLVPPQSRR